MNPQLKSIKDCFIGQMKEMDSVLGAWNFGSETHDLSDEYSDVDLVLLIDGARFAGFPSTLEESLRQISDDILLCWPEGFNGEAIINNGYLLLCGSCIFQFDVFLLNSDRLEDGMCRFHYTGLKESDIIFDRDGAVRKLVERNVQGNLWDDDLSYLEKTYWYHANMAGKYLKRKDYFKLNQVLHTLYQTHISVLLVGFDRITWGGSANKLHFIPEEKQAHLKKYDCSEDFEKTGRNLADCMRWFGSDLKEVCELKGMEYSEYVGEKVRLHCQRILNIQTQ